MENKKQLLGMICALISNLIFGFSFIFSKMALSVAHPLIILSTRFTVAFLILNILVFLRVIHIDFKNKPIKKLLFMSIAQPLCYFILELYGLKMVSSALSGIIISIVPVGVIIYSSLVGKEKPTTLQFICTFVSLLGVAIISILSNDGGKNTLIGILLLAGAVISAVAFNILSRSISSTFSPFERTYFMFLVATIGFNSITATVLNKTYVSQALKAFSSGKFIIAIIYLAIVSSILAFLLYNYSTTNISAVRSSSFSNIITVVSVLAGIFILKEKLSVIQILLCIPIILGVWGVNSGQKEKN